MLSDTLWSSRSEVTGSTEMPSSRDQVRVLVGAVGAAAVFHNAQAAGGNLVDHAVVEQNHAVRHVFFQALAGKGAVAPLGRNDGGHALVLQPAKQPADFGAQHGLVRKARKQRLDGVEHHALGADGVDGVAQADEQAFEVVFAGFFNLGAVDVHVVEAQHLAGLQVLQVEAQRSHVGGQLLAGFLEGHEHARLVVLLNAAHQKLNAHQGFAAARAAANQRGAAQRQAAFGNFIEPFNTRWRLR